MADNLSIDSNQQLYYSIRLNNSDNTLHAWMRHILSYLTANNELVRRELQEPHLSQNAVCDGSCDCQSNSWVHEVSYEEHYRKLLMSRVNVGDTNQANSVDQESLEREASLVMESVDHNRPEEQVVNVDQSTPMDVDSISEEMSHNSDWDFVMYDSDVESIDSDTTYEVSESDLFKLEDGYESSDVESMDDYDESFDNAYNVDETDLTKLNDQGNLHPLSNTYEILSESLALDDGYVSDNTERAFKYRRVSRNNNAGNNSANSILEYYLRNADSDEVKPENEWDLSSK